MKKLVIATIVCTNILITSCGVNNDEKQRIREDSVSINKKPPDSSFNNTNNQNANGGLPNPDSGSIHDTAVPKTK